VREIAQGGPELLTNIIFGGAERVEWLPPKVPAPNKSLIPGGNRHALCFMEVIKNILDIAEQRHQLMIYEARLVKELPDECVPLILKSSPALVRFRSYLVDHIVPREDVGNGSRCGGVAYTPYSTGSDVYGIYFLVSELVNDFEDILRSLSAITPVTVAEASGLWKTYIYHLYVHALTHHVLEDIASLAKIGYPFLRRESEEMLAEYHAYVTGLSYLYYHNPFLADRSMSPLWVPVALFGHGKAPILGRKRDMFKAVIYDYRVERYARPVVTREVAEALWPFWPAVREASVRGGIAYLGKDLREEVYTRVWVTV